MKYNKTFLCACMYLKYQYCLLGPWYIHEVLGTGRSTCKKLKGALGRHACTRRVVVLISGLVHCLIFHPVLCN
jgi:hypothetical protein